MELVILRLPQIQQFISNILQLGFSLRDLKDSQQKLHENRPTHCMENQTVSPEIKDELHFFVTSGTIGK